MVSAAAGGDVYAIAPKAIGRSFRLFNERPGPELNERVSAEAYSDGLIDATAEAAPKALVSIVRISGPLEQRAGWHDECGGWSDGHDAVAERLIEAFEAGDVVLVIDSPGGAVAGLKEATRRAREAKARFGRQCFVYADEEICSAATYWACAIGDEIYAPESAIVGSIGVRIAHVSEAGALKKAGIAVTHITAPGPGKVAFAPDQPLSDLGRERAQRDVDLVFQDFQKLVVDTRGLKPQAVIDLDADALPAPLAKKAGLIDDVATLEEVINMALVSAAARAEDDKEPKDPEQSAAETEEEEDDKEPESEDDKPEKDEEEDEEDKDDEEEDEEDEPDKKEQALASKSTVAACLGLKATASVPAQKSRALELVSLEKACRELTGKDSPAAAAGALRALADEAAESINLRRENKKLRHAANEQKRASFLRRLAAAKIPGFDRGSLFVDSKVDGKLVSKPAPAYAEMKLATLEAFVEGKLQGRAPAASASPFEPAIKEASLTVLTEEAKNLAAKLGADPDRVAASYAALFPTSPVL